LYLCLRCFLTMYYMSYDHNVMWMAIHVYMYKLRKNVHGMYVCFDRIIDI
jgi:hypothetical protein